MSEEPSSSARGEGSYKPGLTQDRPAAYPPVVTRPRQAGKTTEQERERQAAVARGEHVHHLALHAFPRCWNGDDACTVWRAQEARKWTEWADEPRCPHGDPACPCPDGDACHYRDYPARDGWPATKALACWSPDCTVEAPHERAS